MTIKKLIESLERVHNPDAQVVFALIVDGLHFGPLKPKGLDHFHYHIPDSLVGKNRHPFVEVCLEQVRDQTGSYAKRKKK